MQLYQYVKRNSSVWITVLLFIGLCHGTMLLSNTIGIDTEDIIVRQGLFYNDWLVIGRQGLVLLKWLTDTMVFNPYLTGAVTLLLLTLSCILWTYLFSYITGKENKAAMIAFSMLLNAAAILTEQLYFKLQAMEVCIAYCLIPVALYLIYRARELFKEKQKRKFIPLYLLCAFFLNIVTFSVYQVMVALFIFGAAACFFFYYFFRPAFAKETIQAKKCWSFVGIYAGVFLVSFLCNQVITSLFFSGGSYLTSQIQWQTESVQDCLLNIQEHIISVLLGTWFYYPKTFSVFCVCICIAVFLSVFRHKKPGLILAFLSLIGLLTAPFYMTILCGGIPVARSQLVLPFTLAFFAYALLLFTEKKKALNYCIILLCLMTGYQQFRYTMMLNYTDSVRYESDVRIASSLINGIQALEDEERSYPVVFIGRHSAELNRSCVRGETIGASFFEWDSNAKPPGTYSTRRILGFMSTLGVTYIQASQEQTAAAVAYSEKMADWPAQGSIELWNGIIIIKLSDFE